MTLDNKKVSETSSICMRIWGGLGNQMFQHAAGHALAKRLGCALLIDVVELKGAHETFGLSVFGETPPIWAPSHYPLSMRLTAMMRGEKRALGGKKRVGAWPGPVFTQKHFCHADEVSALTPGTYLIGHFQSERFFEDCADDIRAHFALHHVSETIPDTYRALADGPNSVSVHIRRGDYALNPHVTATHGLLGAPYYERAAALMADLVPDAQWLIFSDDIEAADALTANWPNRTLVRDQNREQDLHLMARCAHHIIANSSFSWWGAWLGRNPDRRVIAPRQWFARDELRNVYIDELFPPGWILV